MKKSMESWEMLALAFILDLVLGDPGFFPHPIRWMGKSISALEGPFRSLPLKFVPSGILFSGVLIAGTWGFCWALLAVSDFFNPIFADILETVLIYYALSARSLADSAMEVFKPLQNNKLREAREKVALIVGRDTETLDSEKISKAAIESVAENLVDGFVSPLFYAAIGGAPLAMAFKMVNTLDSMIGYKNQTYFLFGKAAARIDDVANFIPSRLSVPFIAFAAQILAKKGMPALKTALREGHRHASPNSGYPEAAFSGALGLTLGGPSYYQGILVHKPEIVTSVGPVLPCHIKQACDLMLLSALLWALFMTTLAAL